MKKIILPWKKKPGVTLRTVQQINDSYMQACCEAGDIRFKLAESETVKTGYEKRLRELEQVTRNLKVEMATTEEANRLKSAQKQAELTGLSNPPADVPPDEFESEDSGEEAVAA